VTDYRRHATALFGVGAVLALVGSLLPWALVPTPAGGVLARTALHGDGALTAALSGAGLALALFSVFKPARKAQLFGMVCFGAGVLIISSLVRSRFPAEWRAGVGLLLTLAGGAAMVAGTIAFTWALQRAPPDSAGGPLPIVRE
jgi:hypothetical protein